MRRSALKYNAVQYNAIHWKTIQNSASQRNTTQSNRIKLNAMQYQGWLNRTHCICLGWKPKLTALLKQLHLLALHLCTCWSPVALEKCSTLLGHLQLFKVQYFIHLLGHIFSVVQLESNAIALTNATVLTCAMQYNNTIEPFVQSSFILDMTRYSRQVCTCIHQCVLYKDILVCYVCGFIYLHHWKYLTQ